MRVSADLTHHDIAPVMRPHGTERVFTLNGNFSSFDGLVLIYKYQHIPVKAVIYKV
jgi:hypothetical protein